MACVYDPARCEHTPEIYLKNLLTGFLSTKSRFFVLFFDLSVHDATILNG